MSKHGRDDTRLELQRLPGNPVRSDLKVTRGVSEQIWEPEVDLKLVLGVSGAIRRF